MVKYCISGVLAIGFGAFWVGAAEAGNGNGRATGSVCDEAGLIGSAYAACYTYCESLDCDSNERHASDTACARSLERFLALNGGEQPPCIHADVVQCPCDFGWRFAGFLPASWSSVQCTVDEYGDSGKYVMLEVVDSDENNTPAQLSVGWYQGANDEWRWISSFCDWSSSSGLEFKDGQFSVGLQLPPNAVPDDQFIHAVYAACETAMEGVLAGFGLDLGACEGSR